MTRNALVIGGGPAGLMAADILSQNGVRVTVAEAKPSVGRKFLMAGKSGLNLTKDEPADAFATRFFEANPNLAPMIAAFGPAEVKAWAEALGQEVFTGSTGRVFPRTMKASPLLRAWLGRLSEAGVTVNTRWRWTGWNGPACTFDTPTGATRLVPDITILAMGGASWARLGSDGHWARILAADGIPTAPFRPSNAGLCVHWSEPMHRHLGQPVKQVRLTAGDQTVLGECVITRTGLEGSAIYALSRPLRDNAPLTVDLMPDWTAQRIATHLSRPRGKASLTNHLRKALKLPPVKLALLQEFARPFPADPPDLTPLIKALPIRHTGPRPIDEAISSAGGLPWQALTPDLMLQSRPGTYACGEMLDWEAPTGGYLITACLATGRWAAHAALQAASLNAG